MKFKFALAGNPNCGKTTMFNALTGANQYVGNWPGVTVEKKSGKVKKSQDDIEVVDTPGVYSLSPYTLEEVVTRDFILKEKPDVILDLVDATNLERNLYLTTQLIETGIPVVIALNMTDLLKQNGITIDVKKLSQELGCPIVETSALKKKGLDELLAKGVEVATGKVKTSVKPIFNQDIETVVSRIEAGLPTSIPEHERRWYAVKMIEQDKKVLEELGYAGNNPFADYSAEILKKYDDDGESIITDQRYQFIQRSCSPCIRKKAAGMSISDKIDSIVTNRILGLPIFAAVMFLVYYVSVTTVGTVMTDWTNDSFVVGIQDAVAGVLATAGASDLITSLIVDGIIGGVGTVLGFVPQMALLFLLLSILEDVGYMTRIAFVMDRVFRHFGLSGKSFIPLLISSGCGVPGIMASRTIENDNDRRLTIMTATFIPCGAKLPVIALMGGVMSSYLVGVDLAGIIAPMMYFMGIVAVLVSAIMLKKTKPFSGDPAPFVMELPAYHIPSARTVLLHVWERLRGFIVKAGTILFLAAVVMWFLSTFGMENGAFGIVENADNSILAIIGGAIAVLFAPLGWAEWQPVASSIAGFTAKEAIVSTMGTLANVTGDVEDPNVVATAIGTWFPSLAAAFSFLVFNLIDSPCLAAISTMAQQMQSRKWFWFAIVYQNVFAYCIAMMIYQFAGLATGVVAFNVWTVVSIVVLLFMLYMLFRPDPYKGKKAAAKSAVEVAHV